MKKNILTIVILALTIVNVILTSLIVFVVVPTTNKTNKLISNVASIIDLELESPYATSSPNNIKVTDIENYTFEDKLTLNLKGDANDSKEHYVVFQLSLSMNKQNEDYEKYKSKIEENESQITEIVADVFSSYTITEAKNQKSQIKEEVLGKIQEYFGSDFIINVAFGSIIFQ